MGISAEILVREVSEYPLGLQAQVQLHKLTVCFPLILLFPSTFHLA